MFRKIIIIVYLIFFATNCDRNNDNYEQSQTYMKNLSDVPKEKWKNLETKFIYFGHQSVGYNIVDGIKLHLNDTIRLKIKNSKLSKSDQNPVFAHAQNGKNGDPKSKINDFVNNIRNGIGSKANVAGFKFCYVDIDADTNVEEVFQYYTEKIDGLSSEFPELTIMHFSAPLRPIQKGIKAKIKTILGKSIGIEDNFQRKKFNTMMADYYGGKSFFDLAKIESTYENGDREFSLYNNEKVYSMIRSYTYDWGHLSEKGKDIVGKQFLIFLAEI